ncbi:MAG: cytochrome c biogenesis protein CcsA [Acidobacteria bacterium]|nr:cytochrome c biogenesis protein CcsA [Acidobacteriota bacterium]
MRERWIVLLGGVAAVMLVRDLYVMLLRFPDEVAQGAIFRIIFFHVPAAWTAFLGFLVAFGCSILYLTTRKLRYDAVAVAVTEVGLAFGAANLVSGMVWGRIIWGIWWNWDTRLTSMLVCWLLYAGYLMLRRAVEEPTQRARFGGAVGVCLRRRADRFLLHQVVADSASAARGLGRRVDGSRVLENAVRELGSADSDRRHADLDPPAAGREPEGNRRRAALGARAVGGERWTSAISLTCFTASPPSGCAWWLT